MQVAGQQAGRVGSFQHHGAGAVAEQHTGGAILEIENARKNLGTDHQRLVRGAGANHGVGHRERVDKTTADRLHVKRRAPGSAEFVLQDAGSGWKHHVGCGGRDDDQVDLAGGDAGGLQRMATGLQRQVAAEHAVVGKVAGPDAGALHDPVVRALHPLSRHLGHQVGVAEAARRQVAAGAGDAGVNSHGSGRGQGRSGRGIGQQRCGMRNPRLQQLQQVVARGIAGP